MRPNTRAICRSLSVLLLLSLASLEFWAGPKPLPDAVVRARFVFLENETGFHELEYSTGLELSKWGRFELAESREKADLILRLDNGNRVRAVPEGQFPGGRGINAFSDEPVPPGHTRIAVLDPKTSALLWSDVHRTEGGKVKNGHLLDGLREAFDSYDKAKR
jgi:hypothetical protein